MIKRLLFIAAILWSLSACEEVIQPLPNPQVESDRIVLLEEFSGGNCQPCSDAADEINTLLGIHGENLVVVTMHTFISTPQAQPAPGATYDFRTEKGTDIINFLGIPFGIPTGSVNRRPVGINDSRLISPFSAWAGVISDELQRPPRVALGVESVYDETSREATFTVNVLPNENIEGDLRVTLMIAENDITDKQLTDEGVIDFKHKHILRDVVTSVVGDNLATSLTANELVRKEFSYTVPQEDERGPWLATNCEVIAFVTLVDDAAGEQEVLQAAQTHLIEQ
ncbi:MAG: Omp28-related outer membrane protein [Saprospiraceae bacterium]|nr:Omp28-related outer membrane protein [Saprospiraceae bacterium]